MQTKRFTSIKGGIMKISKIYDNKTSTEYELADEGARSGAALAVGSVRCV